MKKSFFSYRKLNPIVRSFLFQNTTPRQIILKNTFWLFAGTSFAKIFKWFLILYAATILGVEKFGAFNYVFSFIGFFFIFADIGIGNWIIREYQKGALDVQKVIGTGLATKFFFLILSSITAPFGLLLIHDDLAKSIYFAILILQIIQHLKELIFTIVRAINAMQYEGLLIALEGIVTVLVGLTLLHSSASLQFLILAYLFGSGLSLAISIYIMYPILRTSLFDQSYIGHILIFSLPLTIQVILTNLLINTDTVLLGMLKGNVAVGEYSPGVKIVQMLLIIPNIFSTSLFPIFSRLHRDKEQIVPLIKTAVSYMIIIGTPISIGGIALARSVMKIFGDDYISGTLSFQILLLLVPFIFIITILNYALFAMNLQRLNMFYTGMAAFTNILSCIIFIPLYGTTGASISISSAYIMSFILTVRLMNSLLSKNLFILDSCLKVSLSSLIMFVVMLFFSNKTPTPLIFILGSVSYFSILLILKERYILQLFNKVRIMYRS